MTSETTETHEIATNKSIAAGNGKQGTFAEMVYASPLRSLL